MITVYEAFRKFRSRLELTQKEQDDASRRQQEIRGVMAEEFNIDRDFLTGSYKRHTKTKPLKDVDIFCVFHDDERPTYRNGKGPKVILDAVEKVLVKKYGKENVRRQRRSIGVEFTSQNGDEERVMSFDVVPAFTKSNDYEIPDEEATSGWTNTNPTVHEEKATKANEAFSGEWKGMVRMVKAWNREKGKPVKPSFLLEVMALDILKAPFGGDYPYEFMSFYQSASERIGDVWPDPAGLGPAVNDKMSEADKVKASKALKDASDALRAAINLGRQGQNGEALKAYRELFGPLFPLS